MDILYFLLQGLAHSRVFTALWNILTIWLIVGTLLRSHRATIEKEPLTFPLVLFMCLLPGSLSGSILHSRGFEGDTVVCTAFCLFYAYQMTKIIADRIERPEPRTLSAPLQVFVVLMVGLWVLIPENSIWYIAPIDIGYGILIGSVCVTFFEWLKVRLEMPLIFAILLVTQGIASYMPFTCAMSFLFFLPFLLWTLIRPGKRLAKSGETIPV